MKSTPLTQGVSLLIGGIYIIYALMTMPLAGTLISIAVGLIAFAYLESTELAVGFTVIIGTIYTLIYRSGAAAAKNEGFVDGPVEIAQRIATIKKEEPTGPRPVLSSSFAEGFQDASGNDTTTQTNTSAESKPASPNTTNGGAMSDTPPPPAPAAASAVKKQAASGDAAGSGSTTGTSGFKGSTGKEGEFQLGVIPEDKKGGYHIDQGTTIINALNSLKPDQVKAMTDDTRKLIETQKNLMSMLGTMKPMLQDGRQMMQNFQEMFGNNNGAFKF